MKTRTIASAVLVILSFTAGASQEQENRAAMIGRLMQDWQSRMLASGSTIGFAACSAEFLEFRDGGRLYDSRRSDSLRERDSGSWLLGSGRMCEILCRHK